MSLFVSLAVFAVAGVGAPPQTAHVTPRPARMVCAESRFTITPKTRILVDAKTRETGRYLADALATQTGVKVTVLQAPKKVPDGSIVLKLDSGLGRLGDEGYSLDVTPKQITMRAPKGAGVFYACQTLRQLLPLKPGDSKPQVPTLSIEDKPRYAWRGSLLDCCRHIWPKAFIKRYIDLLATYKMNVLHWHLTDDQGWRIEIKKYPKLTEIGAWRDQDGKPYGGFYTQNDVKEIVAYAASRHVTVVPEIEMPGHAVAALAAYPELSCTGKPMKVETQWGVFPDVFCVGNEKTLEFLEDVLTEVLALFPSRYIHVGGDECPRDRWKVCPKCQDLMKAQGYKDVSQLQGHFTRRIDAFLTKHGRKLVAWDESLEDGLPTGATIQSWRGIEAGILGAKRGNDVIMSPGYPCYLDYANTPEGLKRAYAYQPTPDVLTPEEAAHVLGIEGNMWTEHTPLESDIDRQVFPRLVALAEVAWSSKEVRDWDDFSARMATEYRRLDAMGVKYYRSPLEAKEIVGRWDPSIVSETPKQMEWDVTKWVKIPGQYEFTFFYTGGAHGLSLVRAALVLDGQSRDMDAHEGFAGVAVRNNVYRLTVGSLEPGQKAILRMLAASDGGTDSSGAVAIRRL